MIIIEYLLSIFLSFLIGFFITPKIMNYLKNSFVVGTDIHKKEKPVLASSLGFAIMVNFLITVLIISVIFYRSHFYDLLIIYSILISSMIAGIIGFLDDIGTKSKQQGLHQDYRVGLSQKTKLIFILLCSLALIPIISETYIEIPFLKTYIDFGWIYTFILVPLAFIGCVSGANAFEGYNGIATGSFTIIFSFLTLMFIMKGNYILSLISLIGATVCLIGYFYNRYPAKYLPGDSLTFFLGALFCSLILLGKLEVIGIIMFIPWIIDVIFFKIPHKLKSRWMAKVDENGILKPIDGKVEAFCQFFMTLGNYTEKELVYIIHLFVLVCCLLSLAVFLFFF